MNDTEMYSIFCNMKPLFLSFSISPICLVVVVTNLYGIRGCIQKFTDWVDNEICAYNNKHSLRSNTKDYGGKTRYTDSQNRDTSAPSGSELYHLQFSFQAASPKTFGYILVLHGESIYSSDSSNGRRIWFNAENVIWYLWDLSSRGAMAVNKSCAVLHPSVSRTWI
jgi:hypothetical protein